MYIADGRQVCICGLPAPLLLLCFPLYASTSLSLWGGMKMKAFLSHNSSLSHRLYLTKFDGLNPSRILMLDLRIRDKNKSMAVLLKPWRLCLAKT
ncbi:hypothetical protein V8C42DRAFT_311259 [Trichoderma barbatum]